MRGGGAERAMLDIARGLSQRGLDVDIVLVKAAGPYLDFIPADVRLVDLGARRALLCLPALVRYLRRERPSVLISTSPEINVAAILAQLLFARSVAVFARRASTFTMEYSEGHFKERLVLRIERLLLRFAAVVISNSIGAADDLREAAPHLAGLTHAIRNPVVWPDLKERASETVNHPWFEVQSIPVILSVGRLVPVKDYPTLLKAFAWVVLEDRPARLVVLGEGQQREALERLAVDLGVSEVVDLPGFVANPFSYMARAAVFALSSRYEGSPNALVQAMSCGIPVVSTDVRSGPREILQDGALGRLVPIGDWRALGQAILETLDSPVESDRLVEGTSHYRAESSIRQYMELISELSKRA